MDPNALHLIIAAVLTVVGVVITALIWKSAQVKTVFWWIGLTMIPMAIYLVGLAPAVAGAITTLRIWWGTLTLTPIVWVGIVMGGLGALLIFGSRLIPSESRADRKALKASGKDKKPKAATPAKGGRPAAVPARPSAPAPAPTPKQAPADDSEFDEIADLLRKRGIN
ncbi:MAG: hypothetical protein QM708_02010 [Propioniciclava sp.]|uniref:hypothetical protein n=1 Tax=Propioniciclava sp. TaxID=2038686 RepID=UPI0039E3AB72